MGDEGIRLTCKLRQVDNHVKEQHNARLNTGKPSAYGDFAPQRSRTALLKNLFPSGFGGCQAKAMDEVPAHIARLASLQVVCGAKGTYGDADDALEPFNTPMFSTTEYDEPIRSTFSFPADWEFEDDGPTRHYRPEELAPLQPKAYEAPLKGTPGLTGPTVEARRRKRKGPSCSRIQRFSEFVKELRGGRYPRPAPPLRDAEQHVSRGPQEEEEHSVKDTKQASARQSTAALKQAETHATEALPTAKGGPDGTATASDAASVSQPGQSRHSASVHVDSARQDRGLLGSPVSPGSAATYSVASTALTSHVPSIISPVNSPPRPHGTHQSHAHDTTWPGPSSSRGLHPTFSARVHRSPRSSSSRECEQYPNETTSTLTESFHLTGSRLEDASRSQVARPSSAYGSEENSELAVAWPTISVTVLPSADVLTMCDEGSTNPSTPEEIQLEIARDASLGALMATIVESMGAGGCAAPRSPPFKLLSYSQRQNKIVQLNSARKWHRAIKDSRKSRRLLVLVELSHRSFHSHDDLLASSTRLLPQPSDVGVGTSPPAGSSRWRSSGLTGSCPTRVKEKHALYARLQETFMGSQIGGASLHRRVPPRDTPFARELERFMFARPAPRRRHVMRTCCCKGLCKC